MYRNEQRNLKWLTQTSAQDGGRTYNTGGERTQNLSTVH
jgi:hypothetical protein